MDEVGEEELVRRCIEGEEELDRVSWWRKVAVVGEEVGGGVEDKGTDIAEMSDCATMPGAFHAGETRGVGSGDGGETIGL